MYRATTPKHTFIFDVNPDEEFKTILISYAQGKDIVLEKGKTDLEFEEGTNCKGETVYKASLRLSQTESNLFNANQPVSVQIRAVTQEDEVVASDKMSVAVREVLNDEVLT